MDLHPGQLEHCHRRPGRRRHSRRQIHVTASDSTTQVVTITISGADDLSFLSGDTAGAVSEDAADNTAAGNLNIDDPDAGDSPTIDAQTHTGTYGALSVLAGGAWTYTLDNAKSATNALDAGDTPEDRFTVTASDSTMQVVTITISGADDAPIITSDPRFDAPENQTEAGTVTAEDVDADDSITGYALGGADAASFSITLSEEDGVLTFNTAPDFETKSVYTITVTATGGAGSRTLDSASQTVVIAVTGVNEAPASPALTNQQAREGEGFTYLFPESTDPEGHPVSYTAWLRDGGDLPAWLTFDSDSRSFTITASEPLSVSGDYDVTVTASDGQTPPLSSEAHFHLTVIAVDAPSFTTPATFSVAENATAVGTVTASDPNPGDTVTSIEITGGADRDRFSFSDGAIRVETASAELMFRSPPDHENPEDAASTGPPNPSGNNEYVVVLTATSGADAKTSTQAITVTVTDVEEPPAKPAAPTVTPGGEPVSLRVTWSAPDTSDKDPIDGYDVRYREEGVGSWKTHPHNDPGTTTTIRGLTAGITCEVQVQATNAEGASDWSDSGTGTAAADTPPRITNPGSGSGGSVGGGGGGSGGVTPAVSVGFKETAAEVSEGSSAMLTVRLSRTYGRAITIRVTAVPGTADAADYAPFTAADLTINPGERSGEVSVSIADDGLAEGGEQFTLRLSLVNAPGSVTLRHAARTVTVIIPAHGQPLPLSFGDAAMADRVLTLGQAARIELPAASGGTAPLAYTLAPVLPAGLTFDAAGRAITGTPAEAVGPISFTYTATDAEGTSVMLTFTITVEASIPPVLVAAVVPTPTPAATPAAVKPEPSPTPTPMAAAPVAPEPTAVPSQPTPAAATPTPAPQPTPAAATPTPAPQPTPATVTPTPAPQPTSAAATPTPAPQPTPAAATPTPAPRPAPAAAATTLTITPTAGGLGRNAIAAIVVAGSAGLVVLVACGILLYRRMAF